MKSHIRNISIGLAMMAIMGSCNKALDKTNLSAVNPTMVWSNVKIATAYLDDIYANLLPGNPYGAGNDTDEGVPYQKQTNSWFTGTATFDSYNDFDRYKSIRSINILLGNIDNATFAQSDKNSIKGQALFWRAWSYHRLVSAYGGVPLILEAQPPTSDLSQLQKNRSKTSECVTQILKDVDDAIALLPDAFTGEDVGRIDKGAAMAFKGRVLLFYASPLFNGLNGTASWQKAYDANAAAKQFLDGHGKGLYAPYNKIWDDELNREGVMFRRFSYPQTVYSQGGLLPINWSGGDVGKDRPSLELVNAFPMKDGSSWDATPRLYDTLFRNRDDRFYADIYYNGSPNQYLKAMRDENTYLWTYYNKITNYNSEVGISGDHNQVTPDGNGASSSGSSFYRVKSIDKNITRSQVDQASVDGIEIRYAEVLMNLGECANEVGKSQEAMDALKQIRNRAGILPGNNGNYGLTATTQDQIRDAYKKERFVEFCFEGKRWDDLRRWKMFGYLRGLPQRHGLGIALKNGETGAQGSPKADINVIWNQFTYTVVPTDKQDIVLSDQYYIYGIPKAVLDRNPKVMQNKNWGGSFDPLQ